MILTFLFSLVMWFFPPQPVDVPVEGTANITVHVTNIKKMKGNIQLGIYEECCFLKAGGEFADFKKKVDGESVTVVFENVPYGEYALGAYHDLDEDVKLDTNFLGMPQEPYGFTRKLVSRFRAPKYKEMAFQVDQPEVELTIALEFWR